MREFDSELWNKMSVIEKDIEASAITSEINDSNKAIVSVIIPIYNTMAYLSACLQSVVDQTLKNIEIICVDDGSEDESRQILEEYARKDKRIKLVFHEKNLGTLAARKHGVKIASGNYIMFLDSDDEFSLNACERAYQAIEKNKTDVVRFGAELLGSSEEGRTKYCLTGKVCPLRGESLLHLWHSGKFRTNWTTWNKIYNAELCKKAYDEIEDGKFIIAEDIYFFFIHGYYAKSYSEIEDNLYKYRQGVGIYSGLKNEIGMEEFEKILLEKDVYDAIERFVENRSEKNNLQPMIQKIYCHLLRENLNFWERKLRVTDKVKGLNLLIKTWGEDSISNAIQLLSGVLHYEYSPLEKRLQKYITARIDIKNYGEEENTVEVIESSDKNAKVQSPGWFKNALGQGIMIQSHKGDIRLKIKCCGNGSLEIALRGVDCRDKNNHRFPVWIDFQKLNVNGEDIFASSHVVWYDKPFKHRLNVADGKMVTIDVEWKAVDNTSEYLP